MATRRSFVSVLALSLLACCAFATAARAQGCRNGSNPALRGVIVRGDLSGQDSLAVWLPRVAATSWLCGYEPLKGWSPDSSDAWCEGVAGVGVGEMLVYESSYRRDGNPEPLAIWAGYGKSPALFRANGRPRQVRVWGLGVWKNVYNGCGEDEYCPPPQYIEPHVVGSSDVELRDVNGWQPLPIPQHRVEPPTDRHDGSGPVTLLGIEIVSVYPGARYTDTCISGIRRAPDPAPRP